MCFGALLGARVLLPEVVRWQSVLWSLGAGAAEGAAGDYCGMLPILCWHSCRQIMACPGETDRHFHG